MNLSERLLVLGKELITESDVNVVLEKAVDHAIKASGAERGMVILFDDNGAHLFQTARHLDKNDIENPEFEISRTIIENVKTNKAAFYKDDVLGDKQSKSSSAARLNLLSVICLPLTHNDQLFGVVYLDNRSVEGAFSPDTYQFIESFGEFISLAAFHALERKRLLNHITALEVELREKYSFEHIIGHHPRMVQILKLIGTVADYAATVLIQGESGTGKDLVARAFHFNSSRRSKPFVPMNCGAIPENLLESELFGHVKGAFTGAIHDKAGLFESADGGTIFLDEVSEMSPALQVKLLRVLQFGEYTKVGSTTQRTCDIRLVAATNKDLYKLVQDGSFRQDLYFRLDVIKIDLPPLRERRSDIPLLVHHFLEKYNKKCGKQVRGLSKKAEEMLLRYLFPGNVRELENAVEHGVIITDGEIIEPEHLPKRITRENDAQIETADAASLKEAKRIGAEKAEQSFIIYCLKSTNGDVRSAAQKAGVDLSNFYKLIKKYHIDAHAYKIS